MQLLKKIYATPTLFLSKKFPTGPFELNMGPPNSTWVCARAHARKKAPKLIVLARVLARAGARTQVKFTAGSGSVQKVLVEISWILVT